MSIQIQSGIPANVVEIGNEITQGVVDGLMSSSPSASSSNPYVTVNGVSGVYLPLAGGTMTGDIGVNYNDLNQVTSIVFADSTVQTTAPVNPADGFTLNTEAIIDTTAGTIIAGNITLNNSVLNGTIINSELYFDTNIISLTSNGFTFGGNAFSFDTNNLSFGNNTFVFGSNTFNFGGNNFNFNSDTMSGSITPNNLYIGGATLFNGTEFYSEWTGGYLFYYNGFIGASNGSGYATWLNYGGNGGLQLEGGGGITFADNTYQDTAPISPANGFTLSSGSTIDTTDGTINAGYIDATDGTITAGIINVGDIYIINAGNITFSDNSTQYTKGDRYKTTSTSSNTINNGSGKSFICDPYLAYTPLQTCIIYSESNPSVLHMHCNVVSYNQSTGELIVDVTSHTGSGTHTDWVINK